VAFPGNLLLLDLSGGEAAEMLNRAGLVTSAAIVLIGAVVGRLHDLSGRLSRELAERRRAEKALGETKVRFRELFDRMTRGMAIYEAADNGQSFIITELNKAAEEINQVERDRIIGQPVREVLPAIGDFGLHDVLGRVWRTGNPEHHPATQYRDDRISLWVENTVFKLPSGEVVAVQDDVTQQRRAQVALQRQNLQLSTLNAISRALSSSLDLEEILDEALSCTLDMLQVESGLILLRDDDGLKLVTHTGLPDRLVLHLEDNGLQDTVCELVYQQGDPVTIPSLAEESPVEVDDLLKMGFRSFLGTPIVHKGEILGALCAFDTVPQAGNESTQALLQAIGQQIAVAVDNARLFEDALREREVAQTLLNTAQTLSTTLRFEPLVERVLTTLGQVVSYDTASVVLVQGDHCHTVACRGWECAAYESRFLLKDRSLIQRIVKERRPVIVSRDHGDLQHMIGSTAGSVHSWLGVPLVSRDKVIGVLSVGSRNADVYDEETAQLASAFAHQTALVIENSRLYEQMRAQLREVTVLQRVTAAISATLDIEQVLPFVARSLCGILNGTSVEIYSLEEGGEVATAVAGYAGQEATEAEQNLRLGLKVALRDSPDTAEALNQNRPLQIRVEDAELDPRSQANLEARGAQAMLLLPIVARQRALGFARVWDSTVSRHFSKGEVATGQMLIHQTAIAMENARLLRESRRRARQLAGAARVAQHAAAITERDHLLNVAVNLIQEQFGHRLAGVFLIDNATDEIYPAAATEDFWRIIPDGYRQPLGWGAVGTAAVRGETVLIGDALSRRAPNQAGEGLSRSSLSVPIQMGERVIGVLEIEADTINAFDESDQLALEIVADQIAIAYQNAELLTQTRSRMQDLQLLHDVSLAAASSTHLQETLQAAAAALASEWEGTQIALQLVDHPRQTLRMKASIGYPLEEAESLDLPLGQGITGWVAQHGQPVLVPDVREDPRYYEANADTRSELCVPLTVGSQVVGTLNVESPEPYAFNPDDQRLLSTLASNLAILIERARLFDEVEATRAQLQERAEALEEANARLKELDRLKSQFLASVSHELRTPLNSVIGFSEVLIDGLLGEMPLERKECVENIYASGEHLMALINDLLDFSKIEAGRMQLVPEPFDVPKLIENLQKTVTPMIEEKSQVLNIALAEGLPRLTADRVRLRQVLLNLLSNAHKFTPAGGEITLSCRIADPANLLFSVADTGIGIRPDDHQAIFEEFRQADGSAMREAEGTGLGLAISKRLVELHGGNIWVESRPGEGATFSFLLPLDGPSPEGQQPEDETVPLLSDHSVSVVEDSR
jgi:signal transduction histidine kinase/PAS domain-containing protein